MAHTGRVEFRPIPANDLLVEILSTSELMIDLAYASAIFREEKLARKVIELGEHVDHLCYLLTMVTSIAAHDKEDAEAMLGILMLAFNSDKISDAATDVSYTLLRDTPVPKLVLDAFSEVEERLAKSDILDNSILIGKRPKELALERRIGADIIAIRRGEDWITALGDEEITAGDVAIIRGDKDSVFAFKRIAEGTLIEFEVPELPAREERVEIGVREKHLSEMLALLIDTAKLSVDLAHSSFVYESKEIAEEVQKIESAMDSLHLEFEVDAIELGKELDIPQRQVLGLLRLALAAEVISDAAANIADVTLSGIEPHPIVREVMKQTADTVFMTRIKESSPLVDKSLSTVDLAEAGMHVIAVRTDNKWIYKPPASFKLEPGDLVVLSGYKESREYVTRLAQGQIQELS